MNGPVSLSPEQKRLLQNVLVVLVEPEDPANIGGAARAVKNTGLGGLVLVQNRPDIPPAAYWVAHASEEILRAAKFYPTLAEALAGTRLAVGTTQRPRVPFFPFLTPEQAAAKLLEAAHLGPVGVVFGRESRGLDNRELYLCHYWSRIPSPVTRPAFNLAQSVLIYGYTLFRQVVEVNFTRPACRATHREYEELYARLQQLLEAAGFRSKDGMERFMARVRRALANIPLESRDLAVMLKVMDTVLKKLQANN